MTLFHGVKGTLYEVGTRIAGGGEGDIHTIVGDDKHVIKTYKKIDDDEKEAKLLAMIKSPPPEGTDITWPKDVIYDDKGKFVGYMMDKITSTENLDVMYEYGPCAKYPDIKYENNVIIAINMCSVLEAVHSVGHVCGDFNPNNINVDVTKGYVKFVDTDSYHITSNGHTFRCPVGMPYYIAPEVAHKLKDGADLSNAPLPTFTQNSDNFALAVHIFQLLMNGAHPYTGAVKAGPDGYFPSVVLPDVPDSILNGNVPFINPSADMTIPKFAPEFSSLPPYLQDLFKKAFIDGTTNPNVRPKPGEWKNALLKFRSELVPCPVVPKHSYYRGCTSCPLCEADNRYYGIVNQPVKTKTTQIPFSSPIGSINTKLTNTIKGNNVRPGYSNSNVNNSSDSDIIITIAAIGFCLAYLALLVYSVYIDGTSFVFVVIPAIVSIIATFAGRLDIGLGAPILGIIVNLLMGSHWCFTLVAVLTLFISLFLAWVSK